MFCPNKEKQGECEVFVTWFMTNRTGHVLS